MQNGCFADPPDAQVGTDREDAVTQFVNVPGSLALVGQQLFTAGVIIDTTAPNNPGGFVSTNSLATTIGM